MIEQVAGTAADQLQCSFRQDIRFDNCLHHLFGQVTSGSGGLDDRRHACQQGRGNLFQHPPYREVKGIDMDGTTFQRHADMTSYKGAVSRKALRRTVNVERLIGQFAPPLAGINEQGADAAVDVDPIIRFRRAGHGGYRVKFLAPVVEIERQTLEHPPALMKCHRAEGFPAGAAAVRQHRLKIQPFTGDRADGFAANRMIHGLAGTGTLHPFAICITFDFHGNSLLMG